MRVYHFLKAEFALDDVEKHRIKISQIDQLNDPFELWCVSQQGRRLRQALRRYKKEMGQRFGMLCFSEHWKNPVLWSHYSDRHRGFCLGFDTDERFITPIQYVRKRTPLKTPPTPDTAQQLLFTKYLDWKYEEEWRGWFTLDEVDPATGFYFYPFGEKLQLREVIAGPLCDTPKAAIDAALKGYADIEVIKARLAFNTFQVVKNKLGFRS